MTPVKEYKSALDLKTGELQAQQPTLSDELFARYQVPSVRLSLGGSVEIAAEVHLLPGLEPGQTVTCRVEAYVADVSAPYTDGKGHRGRVVLRVVGIDGVEVDRGD